MMKVQNYCSVAIVLRKTVTSRKLQRSLFYGFLTSICVIECEKPTLDPNQ